MLTSNSVLRNHSWGWSGNHVPGIKPGWIISKASDIHLYNLNSRFFWVSSLTHLYLAPRNLKIMCLLDTKGKREWQLWCNVSSRWAQKQMSFWAQGSGIYILTSVRLKWVRNFGYLSGHQGTRFFDQFYVPKANLLLVPWSSVSLLLQNETVFPFYPHDGQRRKISKSRKCWQFLSMFILLNYCNFT